MKRDRKGFTLMEILIVVAIIAVLVAVAIPIATAQLERTREAADLANARSAYMQVSTVLPLSHKTFLTSLPSRYIGKLNSIDFNGISDSPFGYI